MDSHSSYVISQGLFLKSLALIYFFAFGSLLVQMKGLYGAQGIQSIQEYLGNLAKYYKQKPYLKMPTLFWLNASDSTLLLAAWMGMAGSLLVIFGIYPAPILLLLWFLYLSFCAPGFPFLHFQWDALLLEVGFISIFFAIQSPPPLWVVYLLWFLLFRLMLSSGLTKLISGSREWHNLTALDFHYETQPLPTRLAYFAHKQPKLLSRLSVIGVYFFELVVPFFIFGPPSLRFAAFFLLIFFQVLIIVTGNFAFFNLLTIALCLSLLPDSYLFDFEAVASFDPLVGANVVVAAIIAAIAGFLIVLNAVELCTNFIHSRLIYNILFPFHLYKIINPYGLFVQMTTIRNEIIIEGSEDGENWKAYEFKWKPGDLSQPPRIVAPHQPRLDWQMWFAALSNQEQNPWFTQFLFRVLEGSQDVLHLLKTNPFPDHPPRFIRALEYRYRFSGLKTKRQTGQWWTRDYQGPYSYIYSLIGED
ncbi:MAG: hypothetical protein K940chlam7_00108 [Chlamydiae bacterium]|nr:hypothetical protein [Chlamydiota bacterium]